MTIRTPILHLRIICFIVHTYHVKGDICIWNKGFGIDTSGSPQHKKIQTLDAFDSTHQKCSFILALPLITCLVVFLEIFFQGGNNIIANLIDPLYWQSNTPTLVLGVFDAHEGRYRVMVIWCPHTLDHFSQVKRTIRQILDTLVVHSCKLTANNF